MMADRIEDILGGVEEEIRRAEERLQLDIFREKATEAGEKLAGVSLAPLLVNLMKILDPPMTTPVSSKELQDEAV